MKTQQSVFSVFKIWDLLFPQNLLEVLEANSLQTKIMCFFFNYLDDSVKYEFSYLDRVNDHPKQGDGRANKTVALLNKCHHGGGWLW